MNKKIISLFLTASLLGPVFAEDAAPVYDADSYPPFDGEPAQMNSQTDPAAALTLSQRIARLEQHTKRPSSEAINRIDSLQAEIQSLRNQVEELSHQLQQFQNQQRALNTSLDKRMAQQTQIQPQHSLNTNVDKRREPSETLLKQTEPTASPKPTVKQATRDQKPMPTTAKEITTANSNNQPNVAEEQQIYQTAYNNIKAKKYNEAVLALKNMLQKYPSGQFAANAHYWLGELYGLMNNNSQSASEFSTVVKDYPDSPKVSDAQLKLGILYAAASNWPQAKASFRKIINKYPGTTSARLASEQLTQVKLAGH